MVREERSTLGLQAYSNTLLSTYFLLSLLVCSAVLLKYDAYTQRNYLAVLFVADVRYLHIWHIFQIV
jgi:hypothetical protein